MRRRPKENNRKRGLKIEGVYKWGEPREGKMGPTEVEKRRIEDERGDMEGQVYSINREEMTMRKMKEMYTGRMGQGVLCSKQKYNARQLHLLTCAFHHRC